MATLKDTLHRLEAQVRLLEEENLRLREEVSGYAQEIRRLQGVAEKYRFFVEQANDAVFIADTQTGKLLEANSKAQELIGRSLDEIRQMHQSELHLPEESERYKKLFEAAAQGKTFFRGMTVVHRDGRNIPVDISVSIIDVGGERLAQGIFHDITEQKQVEEQLRQNEARYRNIINDSPLGIHFYKLEPDDRLIFVAANQSADRVLGVDHAQFVGKTIEEAFPPLARTEIPERYREVCRSGQSWQTEQINYEDEHIRGAFEVYAFQTSPGEMAVMFLDVTRRKQDELNRLWAEESLRESVQFNRHIISNAGEGVVVYDHNLKHLVWNRFLEELTGLPAEDVIGKSALEIFPDFQTQGIDVLLNRALSGETVKSGDTQYYAYHTGKAAWVTSTYAPHYNAAGEVVGVVGTIHDITERRQTEDALRASQLELHRERDLITRLMETSPVGIVKVDRTGQIGFANQAAEHILGLSRDAITRRFYNDPEWRNTDNTGTPFPEDQLPFALVMATRQPVYDIRHAIEWPDGNRVFLSVNAAPILDSNDEIEGIVATVEDITEREHAEQALMESEERFRRLSEAAFEGIVLSNQGVIVDANARLAKMLGYEINQLIGMPVVSIAAPESRAMVERHINTGLEDPYEYLALRSDGTFFPAEAQARSLPYEGRILHVFAIRDITDRWKAEAALRESEARFRSVFEQAAVGILITDLEACPIQANQRFYEIIGYPPEELHQRSLNELGHPDDVEDDRHNIQRLLSGESSSGIWEKRYLRKDGSVVWTTLAISLLRNADGNPQNFIAVVEDISEHKTAEDLLRQSEAFNRAVIEHSPVGISVRSPLGRLYSYNDAWRRIWATTDDVLADDLARERSSLVFDERDRYLENWKGEVERVYRQGGRFFIPEMKTSRARSGAAEWVSQHFYALQNPLGQVERVVILTQDITERKKAEEDLRRMNRNLRTLSECNQILVRVTDELSLLNSVCQLVVEVGGYLLAWIGLGDSPDNQPIRPVVRYGLTEATFDKTLQAWLSVEADIDPFRISVRSRQPIILNDIASIPQLTAWQVDDLPQTYASAIVLPLATQDRVYGCLSIFARDVNVFDPAETRMLKELSEDLAFGIYAIRSQAERLWAEEQLEKANQDLSLAYDATLNGWATALELRERETAGHSQRVVFLTLRLARELGVSEDKMPHIQRGSLLHDIGKMGIPDSILLKPGPLSEDEWVIMHQHPLYAYRLLSPIPYLKEAMDIPYAHHEWWDGSGYPRGLKGDQIPIAARIFAIVDVWDALTADRPYRPAWTEDAVFKHLRDRSGTHFDPSVVEAFFKIINTDGVLVAGSAL